MKRILEAVEAWFREETGLLTLWDPQPVRIAEPQIRLTFMGSEEFGGGAELLKFQLSLTGAGDGPSVFLPEVIKASVRISRLYNQCERKPYTDLDIDGKRIRMSFVNEGLTPSGTFTENEYAAAETNQWSYLWTEPRYMTITLPESFWEEGDGN